MNPITSSGLHGTPFAVFDTEGAGRDGLLGNEQEILDFLVEEKSLLPIEVDRNDVLEIKVPSNSSHVVTLNAILIVNYPEWLTYEAETLWALLEADWKFKLSRKLKDRIQALRAFHASPSFHIDIQAFENISDAWNFYPVDFGVETIASPAEANYTMTLANVMGASFLSERITRYLAAVCKHEGLIYAPDKLTVCQSSLEELQTDVSEAVLDKVKRIYASLQEEQPVAYGKDSAEAIQLQRISAVMAYKHEMNLHFEMEIQHLRSRLNEH